MRDTFHTTSREPKSEKGNKGKRGRKNGNWICKGTEALYRDLYRGSERNMKVIEYFYPTETRMPIVRKRTDVTLRIFRVFRAVSFTNRDDRGIKLSTSKIRLTRAASLLRIVKLASLCRHRAARIERTCRFQLMTIDTNRGSVPRRFPTDENEEHR